MILSWRRRGRSPAKAAASSSRVGSTAHEADWEPTRGNVGESICRTRRGIPLRLQSPYARAGCWYPSATTKGGRDGSIRKKGSSARRIEGRGDRFSTSAAEAGQTPWVRDRGRDPT